MVEDNHQIDIQDIHNIFVAGVSKSGSITKNSSVPLNRIELDRSQFKPEAVEKLKLEVFAIVEGSKIERPISKPDPIAALFMNSTPDELINEDDYLWFEQLRLADKWRGNRIGQINELIINLFDNVRLSSSGKLDVVVYDLESEKPVAIAEVKNRYNTMNSTSSIKTRQTMESLVLDKASTFYGCDAILVERIPKSNGNIVPFNPSDPKRGHSGSPYQEIKRMGLNQFLQIYCGKETAYVSALVLIASFMVEAKAIPEDYDLRFIFSLLHKSLS